MVSPPMPESNMPMGASLVMRYGYMPSLVFTKFRDILAAIVHGHTGAGVEDVGEALFLANRFDGVTNAFDHGREKLLLHLGQIVLNGGAKLLQTCVQLLQLTLLLLANGIRPRCGLGLVVCELGLQLRTHAGHFCFVLSCSRFNRSLRICALGQCQENALGIEVAKTLCSHVGQGERRGQNEKE